MTHNMCESDTARCVAAPTQTHLSLRMLAEKRNMARLANAASGDKRRRLTIRITYVKHRCQNVKELR